MAYLTLWEAATDADIVDVSSDSGFAVKLRGLVDNTQFRLHFYDRDGCVYIAGSTPSAREQGRNWPFVDEAGTKGTILEYNKGILLNKGDCGTMYMRYDAFTAYESEGNRKTFNGPIEGNDVIPLTRARITSIRKVVLSYNVSINNAAVLTARMDFGALAAVNAATGEMRQLFDTAQYTFAENAEDTASDVNPFAPAAGKTVVADSKNTVGEAEAFKNNGWVLGRAARYAVAVDASEGGAVGGSSNGEHESLSYIDLAAVWESSYVFTGWVDESGTTVSEEAEYSTILRDDLHLSAVFVQRYYTVEFQSESVTAAELRLDSLDASQLTFTIAEKEIADPVRAGYTFTGWTLDGNPVEKTQSITVDGDTVFVAAWTVNEYTVSFDTDGGSAVAAITQAYGTALTAPQAPTKAGYTFGGWTLDGTAYTFGTVPAADIELKAVWIADTYTVTFVDEDGETVLATVEVSYGAVPEYTGETPTKAATATHTYTFAGWDKTIVAATADATYTATYTATPIPDTDGTEGTEGNTGAPGKKGCGCGAAVSAASTLWGLFAIVGGAVLLKRKKKEN